MRALMLITFAAATCGFLAGCSRDNLAPDKPGPDNLPASAVGVAARLDAALAISDIPKRNSALATVAEDAATAGEARVLKRAIDGISDIPIKNRAAATAALKLAGAGKRPEATEMAALISDIPMRDEVLSKLAKGEPGR